MGINYSTNKNIIQDTKEIENQNDDEEIESKLNNDYSYCLFCEKHTIIKDNIHCNFCNECHSLYLFNCKKSQLYYDTINVFNEYKKKYTI